MTRTSQHIARHWTRLFKAAALGISYSRGASSVELDAVPASTTVSVEDADGVNIRSKRRDWLVLAHTLLLAGNVVRPQVGDRITNGQLIYEVNRLAGEDCYTPCYDGEVLRVHSRLISVETTQ